ncbi:MAG: hypothetical protein ABSE92_13215 [Terriglobales bacterium]|jgi:hypothetical protein
MKYRLAVMFIIISVSAAAFVFLVGLGAAQAQQPYTPLSPGSVTPPVSAPCPSGSANGALCYSATVQNCPNDVNLGFVFAQVLVSNSKGTVVFFNGGAGDTTAGGTDFANDYVSDGYQVVQVVWDSPWELTGNGTGSNIKYAGCRPATVLNFVYKNIYPKGKLATAGMCAQGTSAGSAAIGYALAEYGSYGYLDNVELLSGPVLSDIEKGCVVPNTPSVTVCPKSQTYCQTGNPPEGGWPDAPQYIGGDITAINNWSGINACNGSSNTTTAQNNAWKQMSIVDGLTDSTFTYPQTAVAGWLCSNTSVMCGSQPCQNNSAAEGQYFYVQISGAVKPFNVYRVDQCSGQEGVESGFLPPPKQTESGFTAIETDMETNCKLNH